MRFRRYLLTAVLAAAILTVGAFGQEELSIAAIQGTKNISPHEGKTVKVTGIVTARIRNGFFLQTPDAKVDADPLTSEGLYIFTRTEPMPEAAVGTEVSVVGKVEEFRPRNEDQGLTITEISHFLGRDAFSVVSRGNPLPKAVVLTVADIRSNTVDQLEKYEGMRVTAPELMVVAPTAGRVDAKTEDVVSDGVFYAVLKGVPRPFREPGMSVLHFLAAPERDKWKTEFATMPLFDGNPEVLRIESSAQIGAAPINVTSKATVTNASGIIHYAYGRYSILLDAANPPQVAGSLKPIPMPVTKEGQVSVAAANIESLFDDEDDPDTREEVVTTAALNKRLNKISIAVRDHLQLPDVFAVIEAENLNVLKKLAKKINDDAVAAGKSDPKYEAYLIDGNDPRGIDCGFLIKATRVKVVNVEQLGKKDKFKQAVGGNEIYLNDRPPLVLVAEIDNGGQAFRFTVVANHLKSYRGADDPKDGPNVRLKKRLQAEFLAKWVDARQKADPNERILLVGDFNSFAFNDGLVDQIGTIVGKVTPRGSVLEPSDDLVERDLVNLVDLINADQRYSYTFDGNAQVLDHFIANQPMRAHLAGFGFLRVNADHPAVLRSDMSRVERFSDHDVAVGYFNLNSPAKP